MIKIYKSNTEGLKEIEKLEDNSWINIYDPTIKELATISADTGIDNDLLNKLIDNHETSRIEVRDGATLIVLTLPIKNGNSYRTVPFGIIVSSKYIVTICHSCYEFIENLKVNCLISTTEKTNFTIHIFLKIATLYLDYLALIQENIDNKEKVLYKATSNVELKGLLQIQKSLVYFVNALNSNEIVLERIITGNVIPLYKSDNLLLEDAIIENKQAITMANLYQGLLASLTDSYGTIISNNLNGVMKFLAGITIVFSIPTMISSFMGMNVKLGYFNHGYMAFPILVIISLIISIFIAYIFKRKNWL